MWFTFRARHSIYRFALTERSESESIYQTSGAKRKPIQCFACRFAPVIGFIVSRSWNAPKAKQSIEAPVANRKLTRTFVYLSNSFSK
jgi:hypothetical protein